MDRLLEILGLPLRLLLRGGWLPCTEERGLYLLTYITVGWLILDACELLWRGTQVFRCYLEIFTLVGDDIGDFFDFRHWITVYRQLWVCLVCTLVALDIDKPWPAKLLKSFIVLSDSCRGRCRVIRAQAGEYLTDMLSYWLLRGASSRAGSSL